MHQPKYTPGRRAVRWMGLTRNPLRRRVDRLERTFRIAALLATLAVVVTSTLTVLGSYHRGLDQLEVERARLQQVPVVLLGDATTEPAAPGVPATWTLPDGTMRTGNVYSPPGGTGAGASVTVWMDEEYTPVRAPIEPAELRFRAGANVLGCISLFVVLIWGAYQWGSGRLDARRDADWTRGWLLYERRWRDRLH